jgi:hypothetical protein
MTPSSHNEIVSAFCIFNSREMSADEERVWNYSCREMIVDARGLDIPDEQVKAHASRTADRELAFYAGVRWAEARQAQATAGRSNVRGYEETFDIKKPSS